MRTRTIVVAAAAVLTLAGCSGGQSGGGAPAAAGSTVVQVRTVGHEADVLTDARGRTLYVSDQESGGKVLCSSGACTAIWAPLTVPGGQKPTAPTDVASQLTTVMRDDGKTQVALDGKPLYTFTLDGKGQTSGDGQHDSFDGTDFSWHTATTSGASDNAPAPSQNNGGGY
jgi:predicted lipoprotein with Yx(FWY)xxD motif